VQASEGCLVTPVQHMDSLQVQMWMHNAHLTNSDDSDTELTGLIDCLFIVLLLCLWRD